MQPIEDPFGDSPFKAIPSTDSSTQPQPQSSATSFHPATNQSFEPQPPQLVASKVETVASFNFGDSFSAVTYSSSTSSSVQLPSTTTPQFLPPNNGTDILADILPPSGPAAPPVPPQTGFLPPTAQFSQPTAANNGSFHPQLGSTAPAPAPVTNFGSFPPPYGGGTLIPQTGSLAPVSSQVHTPAAPVPRHNGDGQVGPSNPIASTGSLALVPQQPKDKFETKSTVWADTLSRGLVNLNISGRECFSVWKENLLKIPNFNLNWTYLIECFKYLLEFLNLYLHFQFFLSHVQLKLILWRTLELISMRLIGRRRGWRNLLQLRWPLLLTWAKQWDLVLELVVRVQAP